MTVAARRFAWAVAGGLLLYGGHPPWDQAWAGYVALVPLLALARDISAGPRPARPSFGWGVVAGLVFFVPLLVWIGRFGVAPWLLLSLVQALFVGVFVALVARWGEAPLRGAVAVAAWVGLEWLRSSVPLSGFPWGVLAYTQHGGGPVLPLARVTGALGLSAALAAVAVSLESAAVAVMRRRWRSLVAPAVTVAVLGLAAVVVPAPPAATDRTIDVAAVQGNDVELPPFVDRADTGRIADIADRMVTVTSRLAGDAPDLVVWPENALDSDPRSTPAIAERVVEAQGHIGDATLIAGTLLDGDRDRTFRNTMVRFGDGGKVADIYDKRVLVPFGEYVPWRPVLGGLAPLQAIPTDGVPGDRPHTFVIDGVPVGPITCYESIFPGLVRDQVRAGAQVLVVTTNNASFGRTPASRQHLAFSQVRAVETGRWIMHAGISGISGVVDPSGNVSQTTALFEQAIVRAELPLVDGDTAYVRLGDVLGPAGAALTVLSILAIFLRRRRPDGAFGPNP